MTRTTNRWQQACAVQQETEGRLKRLIGMGQGSAQRAALARLRRGIGRRPGELPELCEEFTYLGSYSEVV